MKKVILCFLLLLCPVLASCGGSVSHDPFAYTDTAFSMTVRGELCRDAEPPLGEGTVGKTRAGEPLSFAAEVSSEPLPAGTVIEGLPSEGKAYRVSVTYTAPEALAGLSVTCAYGGQGTATAATVTYPSPTGELSALLPYESVKGLLAPALALLPQGDVNEVDPVTPEGSRTVRTQEATYTFSKGQSFPSRVEYNTGEGWVRMWADALDPS